MYVLDANYTFSTSLRCPNPACSEELAMFSNESGIPMRCPSCGVLYESVLIPMNQSQLKWARGPGALYCTFTGEPHVRASALEWADAGGTTRRTFSQQDPKSTIFGEPDIHTGFDLKEGWGPVSISSRPVTGTEDHVSTLTVLKNRLIATSVRGDVGIFELETGRLLNTIQWPFAPAPAPGTRPLEFPPVGRGSMLLVCARHQAVLLNLAPCLTTEPGPGFTPPPSPVQLLKSDHDYGFIAPPLAIDGTDGPVFCLAEGNYNRPDSITFRFFVPVNHGLQEVARHRPSQCTRGPLFDELTQRLVWLDNSGNLYALSADGIPSASNGADPVEVPPSEVQNHWYNGAPLQLRLNPRDYASFNLSHRVQGHGLVTEVAVLARSQNGHRVFWRAQLNSCVDNPDSEPQWLSSEELILDGDRLMMAVGDQSLDGNVAGSLIGLASEIGCTSYNRNLQNQAAATTGHAHGFTGTFDPPVITGAGLVVRTPGRVELLHNGLGWAQRPNASVLIDAEYQQQQGLVVADNRIYFGDGLGVRCVEIVKETAG